MTLRDRYAAALRSLGYAPTPTRSRRYVAYARTVADGIAEYVWLGPSGGLRYARGPVGNPPPIARSIAASDRTRARLLGYGVPDAPSADYDARHGVRSDGYPPSDQDPSTGTEYGEVA